MADRDLGWTAYVVGTTMIGTDDPQIARFGRFLLNGDASQWTQIRTFFGPVWDQYAQWGEYWWRLHDEADDHTQCRWCEYVHRCNDLLAHPMNEVIS